MSFYFFFTKNNQRRFVSLDFFIFFIFLMERLARRVDDEYLVLQTFRIFSLRENALH